MTYTVLLIDDAASNRSSVKRILRQQDIKYLEAENGA